jgi:ABC-type sugar transport system permease subunit
MSFVIVTVRSRLAGMNDTLEQAAMDLYATPRQTFWRVTFPLLRPGHYFVATVAVIGALQLFDQAFIGGGVGGDPNYSLMTPVLYLYNATFKQFNFSFGASIGVILFLLILVATLAQRRLFGQAPSW